MMINPNMPNMPNMPGMGAMTDTLDFVKNLWGGMGIPGMNVPGMNTGGMNIPGMVIPTLSVEEINKKITDLKAVESWLNLNMGMLRSTIQALEVQAATLATLQSMGEAFSATMNPGGQQNPPASNGEHPRATASSSGNGSSGDEKMHAAPEPTSRDESDAASLTAPLVNAAAWWNMLQDQFKQAVSNAMPEPATASDQQTKKPAAKPRAKAAPASGSASRKRKTTK